MRALRSEAEHSHKQAEIAAKDKEREGSLLYEKGGKGNFVRALLESTREE